MQLNGNSCMDTNLKDDTDGIDGSERYVPFDIDSDLAKEVGLSEVGAYDSNSIDNGGGTLPSNTKNSFNAADILKTLFFILMWYTFSTFLTL